MQKDTFKCVQIKLFEVENGFQLGISWSFNERSTSSDVSSHGRDYIAKDEKEAMKIIQEIMPLLADEDED